MDNEAVGTIRRTANEYGRRRRARPGNPRPKGPRVRPGVFVGFCAYSRVFLVGFSFPGWQRQEPRSRAPLHTIHTFQTLRPELEDAEFHANHSDYTPGGILRLVNSMGEMLLGRSGEAPNGLEMSRPASPRLVSHETQTLGWPGSVEDPRPSGCFAKRSGGGSIELLGRLAGLIGRWSPVSFLARRSCRRRRR